MMPSWLKQLFRRGRPDATTAEVRRDAAAEPAWSVPPGDPRDVAGWDRYWTEQVGHGVGADVFDTECDDRSLVEAMRAAGLTSVLCAGSGISQEPRALAAAGCQVVALDFSRRALEIAQSGDFPPDALERFCGPKMRRNGGQVTFVVGDFLDPAVCPGPFDVIIERSTAQLFADRDAVLGALAKRLAPNGIFLSHSHDARWRPPAPRQHLTASWFRQNGWTIWNGWPAPKPPGRVVWLYPEIDEAEPGGR
jgi:SAM-dependent methyltransferase